MALERVARSLAVDLIHIRLEMGKTRKQWKSCLTGEWVSVEDAVLHHYQQDGWRGYSGEGGLVLNLIKAMSFPKLNPNHASTFIEALYAQNVSFEDDYFETEWLLDNLGKASPRQIERNFDVMAIREIRKQSLFRKAENRLEFFPTLEKWMLTEFVRVVGNETVRRIAEIFAIDPYKYRAGWPDVTIWNDGQILFLEVKARGDSVHKSQKQLINDIIKPLDLPFALVDVAPAD